MPNTKQELTSFQEFVEDQLSNGGSDLSLDELFDLWRSENPSEEIHDENVAAINAAIRDFRSGDRGTPAGEHSAELRRQFESDRT